MSATDIAESAQALFCSLADYMQLKKDKLDSIFNIEISPTYEAFKVYWNGTYKNYTIEDVFKKNTETNVTQLNLIENFLMKNNDWYKSSVLIAKTLIEDIDKVVTGFKGIKRPKPTEIWFSRGDDQVMKNIEILFKRANETREELNNTPGSQKRVLFGNLNKWNPADIYFATNYARKKIEKEVKDVSNPNSKGYLFSELNTLISDLIEEGQLLPLSLKKSTKRVILVPVNFDRQYEVNQFKDLKFVGLVTEFQKSTKDKLNTRDITIKYNPKDPKFKIQIKHDVSNGSFKLDVLGIEARGGGISSIDIFASLMSQVDKKEAESIKRIFNSGNKKFKDWEKNFKKTYGRKPSSDEKSPLREQYEKERRETSALEVVNQFIPPLVSWLKSSQPKANKLVKLLHEYATSRTEDSGKFVIAK